MLAKRLHGKHVISGALTLHLCHVCFSALVCLAQARMEQRRARSGVEALLAQRRKAQVRPRVSVCPPHIVCVQLRGGVRLYHHGDLGRYAYHLLLLLALRCLLVVAVWLSLALVIVFRVLVASSCCLPQDERMLSGLAPPAGAGDPSPAGVVPTPRLANTLTVNTHISTPVAGGLASPVFTLHHVVQAHSGYSPRSSPAMPLSPGTPDDMVDAVELRAAAGSRRTVVDPVTAIMASAASTGRRGGGASARESSSLI